MKLAEGTLQTKFYTIIPLILMISSSRITNGKFVDNAANEKTTGNVYSLHILSFLSFGFVLPSFTKKK